jgi:hypothetical protein
MEALMLVEITVKVDGKLVRTHVQNVDGTLEQMEEAIHAMGKRVANNALQASIQAVDLPRPLFRKTEVPCDTAARSPVR